MVVSNKLATPPAPRPSTTPARAPKLELTLSLTVYQGLIPWAWIEASTKGAVLLFSAAEIESASIGAGVSPALAGLLGGMGGGVCQAYATMGNSLAKAGHK